MSSPAFDKTTPVNPPIVNRIKNPIVNKRGTLIRRTPPQSVAIHEKILIPVGTAIIIVAAVK
jgi:hypothetical protein